MQSFIKFLFRKKEKNMNDLQFQLHIKEKKLNEAEQRIREITAMYEVKD